MASADQTRIDELIAHPSEALNVEIKGWIDPSSPEGIAKIAKAAMAIRNRDGGFLIIGFDNETLLPDTHNKRPPEVRSIFHQDNIQGIVSRYAADKFEINIAYGHRDGSEYPIIIIPEGVRVPVACARDLFDGQNRRLLREGDVYFRTLNANGTPSTAAARPGDWADIAEICFENREAEIGRFLRRHLSGTNLAALSALLTEASAPRTPPPPTLPQRTIALLDRGEARFLAVLAARQSKPDEPNVQQLGSWSVALVIEPSRETAVPDAEFLNTVSSSNPSYTGWPVWLDSRSFEDESARPHVTENAWQAFILSLQPGWSSHVDFMRLDPRGEFYLRRILQDDLTHKVAPKTALDPVLMMVRTAEAIAVGLALARGLGWALETTTVNIPRQSRGL